MSLDNLVQNTHKPWLNVRMRELCVQGTLFYVSQPQVNGEYVGVLDNVTGQVGLITPTGPQPFHYSALTYPFATEILAGAEQVIDYYALYSPDSTNFNFTFPNTYVTVTNPGTYLIHYKNNLNTADNGVEMHLRVNGVDRDIVYFTGDTVDLVSMFGHIVLELNGGDQISQYIVNNSTSTCFIQVFGWFTIARLF